MKKIDVDKTPKTSVFDYITQSYEMLADNLVFSIAYDYCYEEWYSTLLQNEKFGSRKEAKKATLEYLKKSLND